MAAIDEEPEGLKDTVDNARSAGGVLQSVCVDVADRAALAAAILRMARRWPSDLAKVDLPTWPPKPGCMQPDGH